jgi:hypothetical protein
MSYEGCLDVTIYMMIEENSTTTEPVLSRLNQWSRLITGVIKATQRLSFNAAATHEV